MCEDLPDRLRFEWPNLSTAIDAAREIERLRAELAAEREAHAETKALLPNHRDTGVSARPTENFDWWSVAVTERRARRKAEAELAAERERASDRLACMMAAMKRATDAEIDVAKLREALQAAFDMKLTHHAAWEERARAVMAETGGGYE
jgi:hypothetical protein